jgi:hypothetical protein
MLSAICTSKYSMTHFLLGQAVHNKMSSLKTGNKIIFLVYTVNIDGLCSQVVRVPGYGSWGLGSIPDATWFSEK